LLYDLFELNQAAAGPINAAAGLGQLFWKHPSNPLSHTYWGRNVAASMEMMERSTRRFRRRSFAITVADGGRGKTPVTEQVVWQRPFCRLLHFAKPSDTVAGRRRFLLVAPMSGHHATLLRGTIEAMLPHGDVYVTDWADAREVPVRAGSFDLDDYIDYVLDMLALLGPLHVVGVCQPSVPVLAAVAIMSARKDPNLPHSMILMGGPIDTRRNPTAISRYAEERGVEWLRRHAIVKVPFFYPGFMREVYPGFLQLTGFMALNFERHVDAHRELYWNLVGGNDDRADKHREFYNEYLSVMDLTAEFYLQTVQRVFIGKDLAVGTFRHRGEPVDPSAIARTALMTIEGERDDISGLGQTEAAHQLCTGIPAARRHHYVQKGVGHYGVFSGRRFRTETLPQMLKFIADLAPAAAAGAKPRTFRKAS
jgi:poly(3-hydroxybutyrate) depolymerase